MLSLHRFIFGLVAAALAGIWVMAVLFGLAERDRVLERATGQLTLTVSALADFNELADLMEGADGPDAAIPDRSAAIWRALLLYPEASIWFESDGVTTAGVAPDVLALNVADQDGLSSGYIHVSDARDKFSVHAALPKRAVLADWQSLVVQGALILLAASIAFIVLTAVLVRALRQSSQMAQKRAADEARITQLAVHQEKLESEVAARTEELQDTNQQLEAELIQRQEVEAELREHDALLRTVAKSAAELLGAHNPEDSRGPVLDLIGKTIAVSRIHVHTVSTSESGHFIISLSSEWCAPNVPRLAKTADFQQIDVTARHPQSVPLLLTGEVVTFDREDTAGDYRKILEAADIRSCLRLPLQVDNKLWGVVDFIDAGPEKRQWNWAEIDALKTLGGLIGISITRARYHRELTRANTIVQNSPTILYRLKGDPSFALLYISSNISKFGYKAETLINKGNWISDLVDPEDWVKVSAAMTRTLERGAESASVEFRLHNADGTYRWVENRYTPVRDDDDRLVEIEGIIIDVTERKAAEDKIATMARTDGLTGLTNRATFSERLRQLFFAAKRGGAPFAVFYLDLDRFKSINDTLGHAVGDGLLKEAAKRLTSCTRETDVVARLGGDEFAIIQTNMNSPTDAGTLASTIGNILSKTITIDGNELHVTSSIGISFYTPESDSPDTLLVQADLALYRAKEDGRNCYRFHSGDLDAEVVERVALADDLRKALAENQLELYYLPQVHLLTGKIVGMEALLRWNHPTRGILSAGEFMSDAERTGTVVALGSWVLDQACRRMHAWKKEGIAPPAITINLSIVQMKNSREFIADVKKSLKQWEIDPSELEFDVTEAMLAQAAWTQNDVLEQLRDLGVKIAIDDFGTAYSSFEYLRSYNVNHLKIAPSFIERALQEPQQAATVRAIVNLGRELNIDISVEGIETEQQRSLLLSISDSAQAQGYYFSEAVDGPAADQLLQGGAIAPSHKPRPKRQAGSRHKHAGSGGA